MDWRDALPGPPEEWGEALLALPRRDAIPVARALLESWVDGTLEPQLLPPPGEQTGLRTLRHLLAFTFATLQTAKFELLLDTRNTAPDEMTARRWCWIEPWVLIEQDEDLMLMREDLIAPLLDEAAARCAKRDYVITIVEHTVRDEAHAALQHGPQVLREQLAKSSQWAPHARRARVDALADYCERLASYATAGPVDAEGAAQRGRDLRKCSPAPAPGVERAGDRWLVDISSEVFAQRLLIEAGSGKMWCETSAPRHR